jgi:hypothetical protein
VEWPPGSTLEPPAIAPAPFPGLPEIAQIETIAPGALALARDGSVRVEPQWLAQSVPSSPTTWSVTVCRALCLVPVLRSQSSRRNTFVPVTPLSSSPLSDWKTTTWPSGVIHGDSWRPVTTRPASDVDTSVSPPLESVRV